MVLRRHSGGAHAELHGDIRAEYRLVAVSGAWSLLGILNLTSRSTDRNPRNRACHAGASVNTTFVSKRPGRLFGLLNLVQESVVWTALRGFRNTPPISLLEAPSVTALRIRATSQLNGVSSQLNGVVTSRVTAFNGTTWVADTLSHNADMFRYVLQWPANARAQAAELGRLETLESWWQYCEDNGFCFDHAPGCIRLGLDAPWPRLRGRAGRSSGFP